MRLDDESARNYRIRNDETSEERFLFDNVVIMRVEKCVAPVTAVYISS